MADAPTGPKVDEVEALHRALYPYWWDQETQKVSSSAFSFDVFSVDIASRTSLQATCDRFPNSTAIAEFNCGVAVHMGYDARLEPNPDDPEHVSHSNVYTGEQTKGVKKAMRRKLAEACRPIPRPD
jgi:hypothetical protein